MNFQKRIKKQSKRTNGNKLAWTDRWATSALTKIDNSMMQIKKRCYNTSYLLWSMLVENFRLTLVWSHLQPMSSTLEVSTQ